MPGRLDIDASREDLMKRAPEERDRGVILALRDMENENQRLLEAVEKLDYRLSDVLSESSPSKCESEPDIPGDSPLSRMLWQQTLFNRSTRIRIQELLERLDL